MVKPPSWTFEGYVTEAGNRPVQEWYYEGLSIDERDLIRDRVNYLKEIERHLWKLPYFGTAGDELWEIRRDMATGWIRIYGVFHPGKRRAFVLLHANDKNVKNDRKGTAVALDRLKRFKRQIGSTHGFDFEERTLREDSKGAKDTGATRPIEPVRGDRISDPGDKR